MAADVHQVDRVFREAVSRLAGESPASGGADPARPLPAAPGAAQLTGADALELFDSQLASRHIDLAARRLRAEGVGYYTIGSAGHEGNAALARALRVTDPAFLHYRSGAFFVERARQRPDGDPIRDILLGVVAGRDEPIAGGRHKVFGSAPLCIPPQTSTIASHLPKAVGHAFALERARRLLGRAGDDIVVASFGDASANHSTATGAINAACRTACHLPCPILLVCEDNGLGISVRTPPGWIATAHRDRPGLRYFAGDGCDLGDAFAAARAAVDYVRSTRRPAFLHLAVVRLMGHAGADVELVYRTPSEIAADLTRDPLLATARLLCRAGLLDPEAVLARYEAMRDRVAAVAAAVATAPRLVDADQVMAPLAPRHPASIAAEVARPDDDESRRRFWSGPLPESGPPLPLAGHVNRTLGDLLCRYPELLVFGMDVGKKGGVYGLTRELERRAGMARVFDTILDEQTILGLAIGAAQAGFLPVAEIQYLAYLHNAEDQLRGEAATLQFFSQGQFRNPMVVRIAAYAYQQGFGGHFHNDNSVAVLRDVPGLIVASPSTGVDAAAMLRTCVAAARVDGAVCVFLEPIARYTTRDLYQPGDGLALAPYRPDPEHVPIGSARSYGDGRDLALVSFGNGVAMCQRVARRLAEREIAARVLDLRWLAPLPVADLVEAARQTGALLVVDETRATGGVSEGVLTALIDAGHTGPMRRVAARDSFIPLGDAAFTVLPGEDEIERAALALLGLAP